MKRNLICTSALIALQGFGAKVFNSSSALTSQGVIIAVGNAASPEVFTEIQEITTIDGPGGQASEIDVTDLSSTAKEFQLGLQDLGDLSLSGFYIPADTQHEQLRTDYAAGIERNYQLQLTDSPVTKLTFPARVKGFSLSNAVDNVVQLNVVLRVTGDWTKT